MTVVKTGYSRGMNDKAIFNYYSTCSIDFETKKCPHCGKMGLLVKNIPSERDWQNDSSDFYHVLKKSKKKDIEGRK